MRLQGCFMPLATKKPPSVMLSGNVDWVQQLDQRSFGPALIKLRRTGLPIRTRRRW
jgi:hypothetical protein